MFPKDRNIAVKINNEQEFNIVKDYCIKKYSQKYFEIKYYISLEWFFINCSRTSASFFQSATYTNIDWDVEEIFHYYQIDNLKSYLRKLKIKKILLS